MHLINTLKQGASETCYLTTRGDSSVKRCQPLVVFGVNPGSLRGRRKKKKKDSVKGSHIQSSENQSRMKQAIFFVLFFVVFFGNQVLHHPWLENIQLPGLSFRLSIGVKIALKLHLSLDLHLTKWSHTPVHATLVLARGGTTSWRAQMVSWKVKLNQTLSDDS